MAPHTATLRRGAALLSMGVQFAWRFRCPNTGSKLNQPSRDDFEYVKMCWEETIAVFCPYCRRIHRYRFKDGYIEGKIVIENSG